MTNYLSFSINLNNSKAVSVYDEMPLWSAIFGLMLLKHIELKPNLQVLDVGCGTGFPLIELAQILGESCHVVGLDVWVEALDRARLKVAAMGIKNITIVNADATNIPFDNQYFDLIVSNLGINNFLQPHLVFKECGRVAKVGAKLVLTTNLRGHMAEIYTAFEETLEQLKLTQHIPDLHQHINKRATVEQLHQSLREVGFSVTQVYEDSTTLRFLDGTALFNHYFIKLGFLDAWKQVVPELQQQAVFSHLENLLNQLAATQGQLKLTIPMAYIEAVKL